MKPTLNAECDVDLPRSRPAAIRTDEDTIALVRRLALHHEGLDGKQHEEVVLLQRVNQRPLGKFEADRNGAALEASAPTEQCSLDDGAAR